MNKFSRLIKENLLPFVVFVILMTSCSAAWFFLHPSSPYHARFSFVVSFDAVGTLSPGNLVKVRGIKRGEITKVELTDDAVYVTVRVLAETKVPRNSEFRLITAGLMGEREVCILTGDSKELVQDGDTLVGHFDEGLSGFGQKLRSIIADLGELKDSVRSVMDSLSDGAQEALEAIAQTGAVKIRDLNALVDRTRLLLESVKRLKDQSNAIMGKLVEGDNSAGLVMDLTSPINSELDKLLLDVDALLEDIKKNGLDINVDIF